jgi:hypothetical protein
MTPEQILGAVRAKSTMASATADGARLRPARAAEAARGSCAEARDGAQAGVAPAARPSASVRTRALPPFVMKVRAKASYPGPRRLHRGSRDCSKRGRPASPRLFVATHSGFRSDFGEGRERHRASDDRQTRLNRARRGRVYNPHLLLVAQGRSGGWIQDRWLYGKRLDRERQEPQLLFLGYPFRERSPRRGLPRRSSPGRRGGCGERRSGSKQGRLRSPLRRNQASWPS